jgi:hypothetical protein
LTGLDAWLRWLRGRFGQTPSDRAVVERTRSKGVRWTLLESVGSAPLGGMYADLLRQAGIPVRIEQWDPGSGALGGLPVGFRILVPVDLLSAAQEVLHLDSVVEGEPNEG